MKYYLEMWRDPHVWSGYEGLGFTKEEFRLDLVRKASSLHEKLMLGENKRIWADKTPEYSAYINELHEFFNWKARYVLVYRHPWDCANSVWRRGWRFNDIGDGFVSALVYVKSVLTTLSNFEKKYNDSCSRIIYHELCRSPDEILRGVFQNLGVDYDPKMVKFWKMPHNFGLEDPIVRGHTSIVEQSGQWRSWSLDMRKTARQIIDPLEYLDIVGDEGME